MILNRFFLILKVKNFTYNVENLDKGISYIENLKNHFPDKFFFIIGETSYGYCCADEVAALHLKAELIIRVGNSCLTKTQNLPVFFLFEEEEFENKFEKDLIEKFIEYTNENIINSDKRTFVNSKKIKYFYIFNDNRLFIQIKIEQFQRNCLIRNFLEIILTKSSFCLKSFSFLDMKIRLMKMI